MATAIWLASAMEEWESLKIALLSADIKKRRNFPLLSQIRGGFSSIPFNSLSSVGITYEKPLHFFSNHSKFNSRNRPRNRNNIVRTSTWISKSKIDFREGKKTTKNILIWLKLNELNDHRYANTCMQINNIHLNFKQKNRFWRGQKNNPKYFDSIEIKLIKRPSLFKFLHMQMRVCKLITFIWISNRKIDFGEGKKNNQKHLIWLKWNELNEHRCANWHMQMRLCKLIAVWLLISGIVCEKFA